MIACSNSINSSPIDGINIQSIPKGLQEKSWFDKTYGIVHQFYKKVKVLVLNRIDTLKRPNANIKKHKCIWKICSKPLKGPRRNKLLRKLNSLFKNKQSLYMIATGYSIKSRPAFKTL